MFAVLFLPDPPGRFTATPHDKKNEKGGEIATRQEPPAMTRRCPKCRRPLGEDFRYCPSCGEPLGDDSPEKYSGKP